MEFYVKFATFNVLKWNFQNIHTVVAGLYTKSWSSRPNYNEDNFNSHPSAKYQSHE